MAKRHKDWEDELQHRAFERRIRVARQVFELVQDVVLLLISVALAVVTMVCALHGSPWSIPPGMGFAAVGFRAWIGAPRSK